MSETAISTALPDQGQEERPSVRERLGIAAFVVVAVVATVAWVALLAWGVVKLVQSF